MRRLFCSLPHLGADLIPRHSAGLPKKSCFATLDPFQHFIKFMQYKNIVLQQVRYAFFKTFSATSHYAGVFIFQPGTKLCRKIPQFMTISILLNMALTAMLSVWTPGPNNVMLLALAGKYGAKKNIKYLLGIWTGCLLLTVFTGFLCQTLATFVPRIQPVMKYFGAAYLIYLAYKTIIRKPPQDSTAETIPTFFEGMMLQVLNVKLIVYAISMYSSFILPNVSGALWVILMAFYLVFFSATGNLLWAFAGSFLKPLYEKYYKIANVVMAILLLWCVLRMLEIL